MLSFQAATLDTDLPDREATLVFRDGKLLAVLSCLSAIHGELAGRWYTEAMFGMVPARPPETFETLARFEEWLTIGA